jgi:hypothetical protein
MNNRTTHPAIVGQLVGFTRQSVEHIGTILVVNGDTVSVQLEGGEVTLVHKGSLWHCPEPAEVERMKREFKSRYNTQGEGRESREPSFREYEATYFDS